MDLCLSERHRLDIAPGLGFYSSLNKILSLCVCVLVCSCLWSGIRHWFSLSHRNVLLIIKNRTCNYGKLNYFLGKRAFDEGRPSLYPTIDFCEFPQGVCSSDKTYGGELQWMTGLFEWVDRVQTYDVDGWNYIEKLKG